jgi:ADP-heptose:LPS heptosyltransferase
VVGIYGPTDPRSYHPWIPGGLEGIHYAVVRSDLPCACKFPLIGGTTIAGFFTCLSCPSLESITAQQVLDAAMRLLEAGK